MSGGGGSSSDGGGDMQVSGMEAAVSKEKGINCKVKIKENKIYLAIKNHHSFNTIVEWIKRDFSFMSIYSRNEKTYHIAIEIDKNLKKLIV